MDRRGFLAAGLGTTFVGWSARVEAGSDIADILAWIERESGGRLGVAFLDTQTSLRIGHRVADRFPLCSTFKLLASAAVLARVDAGREDLQRRVRFSAQDLVPYSPRTKEHLGDGMTLAELCEAAITLSDNTAGNLILASIGGPAGLTTYLRSIGDAVSRLDRTEPTLNEALPGDPRDTTTPQAMLADIEALVLGEALSANSRAQLAAWLLANQTGGQRIRAGVPSNWHVGDKTGAGDRGTTNDAGVLWPPNRKPAILCVYLTDTEASPEQCSATIAAVAKALTQLT